MSLATLNPTLSLPKSQLRRTVQMRERVVGACRLVEAQRSVRGVHIVARRAPTNDEFQHYQEYAAEHHVQLTVDSHGMISIRPQTSEEA